MLRVLAHASRVAAPCRTLVTSTAASAGSGLTPRPVLRSAQSAWRATGTRHYGPNSNPARRHAIEEQRKHEAETLFDSVCKRDGNGERYLDQSSLRQLLVALGHAPESDGTQRLLDDADKRYGPTMTLEHLLSECDNYCRLSKETYADAIEELRDAFNVYDRDGSGSIDAEELMTMLSTTGSQLTLEQARRIIDIFDENGDQEIDFEEFCNLLDEGVISWRFRTGYRVIFVCGGPGSGKGTLAERLARKIGVGHVSTGDLLRVQSRLKSELGLELREIMRKGGLVDAHIVMRMLREYLQTQPGKRVLIDGFPRSIENLVDFEAVCGRAEFVLWFDAPDEILVQRLLARGQQSGRADDQSIETIKRRLAVYHGVQTPLEEYFTENKYKIYRIDASQSIESVEEQLLAIPEFQMEYQRRVRQGNAPSQ